MNLYYIHTHFEWDMSAFDPEYDVSLFVLAFDVEQAISLWCESYADWGVFEFVETVEDTPLRPKAKSCLIVRDITFDTSGQQSTVIDWDNIPPIYAIIREV